MFSDKPITTKEHDIFNRSNLAENLAKVILEYGNKDSAVIGLLGGWGTGKTSIINMVEEAIQALKNGRKKPVILTYNPWNFSNKSDLTVEFFTQLALEMQRRGPEALFTHGGQIVGLLGELVRCIKHEPEMPMKRGGLASIFGSPGNAKAEVPPRDLNYIRSELDRLFAEMDSKLLVVIDDIDRLSEQEICEIFQITKKLANFPNTMYLVAFDYEVVRNSLNTVQRNRGEEYISKIIQLQISVPVISDDRLTSILFQRLDAILKENTNDRLLDFERFLKMFNAGFKHLFKTPRDVYRYLNHLTLTHNLVRNEINIADYLVLSGFQVFLPDLYEEISENKELYTEGTSNFYGNEELINKEEVKFNTIMDDIFRDKQRLKEPIQEVLLELFPNIGTLLPERRVSYGLDRSELWSAHGRVASHEYFDFFFKFAVDEDNISRLQAQDILLSAGNFDEFRRKIRSLAEEKAVFDFIIKSEYLLKEITVTEVMAENIIRVFFTQGASFLKKKDFSSISTRMFLERLLKNVLSLFTDMKTRFGIVKNAIDYADDNLDIALAFLDYLNDTEKDSRQDVRCLKEDDLALLIKICQTRIDSWVKDGSILDEAYSSYPLWFWKHYMDDRDEQEAVRETISKIIIDDACFVKLLTKALGTSWKLGSYRVKENTTFDLAFVRIFTDVEESYNRACRIKEEQSGALGEKQKAVINLFIDRYKGAANELGRQVDWSVN